MTSPALPSPTALIVIDHGSRLEAANAMLETIATQLKRRANYPIVEYAHMELAPPGLRTAFDKCVQRGARSVVIVPYFLSPGNHARNDIPAQAADAAAAHPDIAWRVAAPLGLDERLLEVVECRAGEALGTEPPRGPAPTETAG